MVNGQFKVGYVDKAGLKYSEYCEVTSECDQGNSSNFEAQKGCTYQNVVNSDCCLVI